MKKKKEYPKPAATVYDFSSKYGIMQEVNPNASAHGPNANLNSSLFDDEEESNSSNTTWDDED
jgi:hypothetical protein